MTSLVPTTAFALHAIGQRTIAAYNWQRGSYLKLSDSQPLAYTVHGEARGEKRPSIHDRDHVPGLPTYREYFERAVWVAVRVEE